MKKLMNYYNVYGFIETIKKIFRYISINIKIRLSKGAFYRLSSKMEKNVMLKSKKLYVLSEKSYNQIDLTQKQLINDINNLGWMVNYLYLDGNNDYDKLQLSFQKKIKTNLCKKLNISEDDYCLILSEECNDDKFQQIIKKFNKNNILYFKGVKEKLIKPRSKCKEDFYNNISIIILNHNNEKIIKKCLDSLLKYRKRYNYEIIIIDNLSSDNSVEIISQYKEIKLYKNDKNGCSSGRNLGVKKATKKYILFLDSDQYPTNEEWLDNYIDILLKKGDFGAIGWTAGWFNKEGYAFHTVDDFEYRFMPPLYLCRKDIGYIGSGGMMMSKKLFDEIGGFDENYDPTCYEDTDISLKIRNVGKEIVYCPYLGIIHNPHQTTKSGSNEHSVLIKNKGDYFVKKWKLENKKLLNYRK